jgi:hypothetical protein
MGTGCGASAGLGLEMGTGPGERSGLDARAGLVTVGSRKEKKLCDSECLCCEVRVSVHIGVHGETRYRARTLRCYSHDGRVACSSWILREPDRMWVGRTTTLRSQRTHHAPPRRAGRLGAVPIPGPDSGNPPGRVRLDVESRWRGSSREDRALGWVRIGADPPTWVMVRVMMSSGRERAVRGTHTPTPRAEGVRRERRNDRIVASRSSAMGKKGPRRRWKIGTSIAWGKVRVRGVDPPLRALLLRLILILICGSVRCSHRQRHLGC